jgi:maltose O-acetyltransferase
MPSRTVLAQLVAKLQRDRGASVRLLATKAARYARDLATARAFLAPATSVGSAARTRGRPSIENLGTLRIGDDFQLTSRWVQSHLVTGEGGQLLIGDRVNINFGAAISAQERVQIGDDVRMGPYAIIMDSDFHSAADRSKASTAPITIEAGVWLAARVTVVKGAHIGKGSVIGANSVVAGVIPPGVVAAGVPARVIRPVDGAAAAPRPVGPPVGVAAELLPRVAALLQRVFAYAGPVDSATRAEQVPGWDSLGQLRLVQALEEEFAVTFEVAALSNFTTVGAILEALRAGVP